MSSTITEHAPFVRVGGFLRPSLRRHLVRVPLWKMLTALGFSVFFVSADLNLFERFVAFSQRHERWQLDELATLCVFGAIAGGAIAIHRSRQLVRELRARAEAEEQIRSMALHDSLTGLANRRKLADELAQAIRARKRDTEMTGLLMIDLDRFKPVNDSYGHGVGDRLLKAVADRLAGCARAGELVARLGGDEFALLLPRIANSDAAGRPARRIIAAMADPFLIDNLTLRIGVSVGVALTAETGTSPDALIHHADVALYRAKRDGRGEFRYFEESMDGEIRARANLELAFREAIIHDEIRPYYHPLVELANGRIRGYEILARWHRPGGEMIMPEIFIPIAEDLGVIGEMSLQLLRHACTESASWRSGRSLALNLSPVQLRDPKLASRLMAVLTQTGFPPACLEVEITESALVADFEAAKKILLELKSHGLQIALDDFGTGYSSLNHLRELPFDALKIDRSFILSMAESDESRKIVEAIVGLGRNLGLTTVAEGVESQDSIDQLKRLGCDLGQGFYYGVPAGDVCSFVHIAQSPAAAVACEVSSVGASVPWDGALASACAVPEVSCAAS